MLTPIAVKTVDTLTTTTNSVNDGNKRERITTRFNVTNAAVLGKQNKTAQVNLVHLIAITKTKIDLIHEIETTIAGIAIVETIEMMTRIIADMTIREIDIGTAIGMTTVVVAIEIAGMHEKIAQTPEIAIEIVEDTTDPIHAIAGVTHLIQTLGATISSILHIQLLSFWNSTWTRKSIQIKFVASLTQAVLHRV